MLYNVKVRTLILSNLNLVVNINFVQSKLGCYCHDKYIFLRTGSGPPGCGEIDDL